MQPRREAGGKEHCPCADRRQGDGRSQRLKSFVSAGRFDLGAVRLVAAREEDGAAGAGELRACPEPSAEVDERSIDRIDRKNLASQVEVAVDALPEAIEGSSLERLASLDGVLRERRHEAGDRVVAAAPSFVDRSVDIARTRAASAVPRQQQRRQQRRIEALDVAGRERIGEVHRDQALVRLHEPIERSRADPEHVVLGAPREFGHATSRARDAVPARPAAHRGHEQRARSGETRLEGDVARRGERERSRQWIEASLVQQPLEEHPAALQDALWNRDRLGVPHFDGRAEFRDREAEALAAVEIRRIPEQSDAGVGVGRERHRPNIPAAISRPGRRSAPSVRPRT